MTGCSGVKNLTPADSKMPEAYMPGLESDSACVADMAWWNFYTDSTLCHLIRLTLDTTAICSRLPHASKKHVSSMVLQRPICCLK